MLIFLGHQTNIASEAQMKKVIFFIISLLSLSAFSAENYAKISHCNVRDQKIASVTLYKKMYLGANPYDTAMVLFTLHDGSSFMSEADLQLVGSPRPSSKIEGKINDFVGTSDLEIRIDYSSGVMNGVLRMPNFLRFMKCSL
jgi:hypothetical protein